MVRIHVYLREDQLISLDNIPGSTSELIRQAIDDLINKKTAKAAKSPSTNNN